MRIRSRIFVLVIASVLAIPPILFARRGNAQIIDVRDLLSSCAACTYKVSWNSEGGADYFELFLLEPSHPDGRRRIYKGSSGSAYVTLHNDIRTALIRACNFPERCSAFGEIPLVPGIPNPDMDMGRFVEPIVLLRWSTQGNGAPAEAPARPLEAPMIDITATGQRVCREESNEPTWSIGTRMTVRVAPDIEVTAMNREVVEHQDGGWTWSGDLDGRYRGTLTLRSDRCGEFVHVNIDSDAGQFVVRPAKEGPHAGYEIVPADVDLLDALRTLWASEYARLANVYGLTPDVTLEIRSSLSEQASQVVREFGNPWIPEQRWEDNGGTPTDGVVQVRVLQIDGDFALVRTQIGETAGPFACGELVTSRYSWSNGWVPPENMQVGVC